MHLTKKKGLKKHYDPYWDKMFAGREAVTFIYAETWLFGCTAVPSPLLHAVPSGHVPAFLCPKWAEDAADALTTLLTMQVVPVTIITGCKVKMLDLVHVGYLHMQVLHS